jgi:hypothetical protein
MCTHATSRIGETGLKNCQNTKESLGNIGIFPLLKPNFPSHKIQFSSMAFHFLQRFSDFLWRLSAFFNGFPIFLNGFPLSQKSKKIYLWREVYERSLFELRIFCHSLSHLCSELRNTRYNTQQWEIVFGVTYKLRVKYKMGCRNRYSEGRNNRQMTPPGCPNLISCLKKSSCFGILDGQRNQSSVGFPHYVPQG